MNNPVAIRMFATSACAANVGANASSAAAIAPPRRLPPSRVAVRKTTASVATARTSENALTAHGQPRWRSGGIARTRRPKRCAASV
ncbi:MAG: hypothetical protein U0470_11925 [Anaerolineae bacterium]